jgi:hypothetical protein
MSSTAAEAERSGKEEADVSVVLCAYDEQRFDDLLAAVRSVQQQSTAPREIIVAIDNNPALLKRLRASAPEVMAVESTGVRGAGAARNCGVSHASGAIVAFLDDDAIAMPGWIDRATAAFTDGRVLGVGGTIRPSWKTVRPRWMAHEFYWTMGCTYPGLPTARAPVRNLIAANMFVRRDAFLELDGFLAGFGKTGARSGTDETELCIRANQRWPEAVWLHDPEVAVMHSVPESRTRVGYFLTRCYDEGRAKASIVALRGGRDGLSSERTYTTRILPRGFLRGLKEAALGGDLSGAARSLSIAGGLAATLAGYAVGRIATHRPSRGTLPATSPAAKDAVNGLCGPGASVGERSS